MKYRFVWGILLVSACGSVPPAQIDAGNGGGDDSGNDSGTGPQTLTVTVTGNGSVASAPTGIDCGTTCGAQFTAGAMVTLTATPAADSAFVGWSGDCAGTGPCSVTMDAAKSATAQFATHASKRWVQQMGLAGDDFIQKIATDPDGNVIAAGTVKDATTTFLFVKKLAKEDGHELWKQQIAFTGNVGPVAVDAAGEVYVAGRLLNITGQPVMIGTVSVVGDTFGDIVVVRFSASNGTVVWVRKWGGDGQDFPKAIAVSGSDLYVAGDTDSGSASFDTQTFTNTNGNSAFLVRANATTGAAIQAKLLPSNMSVFGIAVNGTHVAVVGNHLQALTLDACSWSSSATSADAFIMDFLASNLTCQWGKTWGDSVTTMNNNATAKSVAAYPGGGWVVVGEFRGSIILAPSGTSLTSRGDFDVFAGRFAADGTHIWSFRYGNTGFDLGESVAVTPTGNVVLAGSFDASITFGSLTVNGVNNAFVTRMTAGDTPGHEWAVSLGGDNSDQSQSVALGPDGTVYVLGQFSGMTTVAGTALTAQGLDGWLASLVR